MFFPLLEARLFKSVAQPKGHLLLVIKLQHWDKKQHKKIAGHLVPFLRTTLRQREKDLLNTAGIELWLVARALAISEPLDKK